MNSAQGAKDRVTWLFWISAALVAVGAIVPVVLSGTSGRANGVFIPFVVSAVALAVCGLGHQRGRTIASILYFVAGLAIVFGLLSMFSLPLRLAVLGTCPAPPAPCTSGLEPPLTNAENTAIGIASAFGIVALVVGFIGLAALYRRSAVLPSQPPVRKIPPMPSALTRTSEVTKDETRQEEEPELPAHEDEERPELPAHESSPPTT